MTALAASLFGRFNLHACTAKDAVRQARVPILLIHGEDDRLVPWTMSREIAQCCASPVRVEIFPGAGHGLCYVMDPIKYEQTLVSFLHTIPALQGTISREYLQQISDFPK